MDNIPEQLETLKVVRFPDPVLKRVAAPVEVFDARVETLGRRMLELMRQAEGVGLAAPQVGISLRLFVCNATDEPKDDMICVNPKFLELSGSEDQNEGCLSLPHVTVCMRRAKKAVIEFFDPAGTRKECTGEELLARVWQHEMDHLDGRLIIDAMSSTDELANRRAIKQLREDFDKKAIRPHP